MAKLINLVKSRNSSTSKTTNGKRFYTAIDMAELKHMIAKHNRWAKEKAKAQGISVEELRHNRINSCACGVEGCFIIRMDYSKVKY